MLHLYLLGLCFQKCSGTIFETLKRFQKIEASDFHRGIIYYYRIIVYIVKLCIFMLYFIFFFASDMYVRF